MPFGHGVGNVNLWQYIFVLDICFQPFGEYMSVECICWYWIYHANTWGMTVSWRVSVCPSGTGLGMYIMYIMYTIYICIGYMPQHTPKYGGYLIRFWQFWIWQPESSFLIYSCPGLSENIPHLWCFLNFWKTQHTPKYGGYLIRFWQFRIWQPISCQHNNKVIGAFQVHWDRAVITIYTDGDR